MPKLRALDEIKDWTFGKGVQDYATDKESVKFNVETRLNSWLGDCFFKFNEGVDWDNLLASGTKASMDADIQRVIYKSADVIKIITFTSILVNATRVYSATAELETTYGAVKIAIRQEVGIDL